MSQVAQCRRMHHGGHGDNGAAYEDFTTYTEVDPNARMAVTANKIDVDAITRDEDAWVVADKGVDYFGAAFTHDLEVTPQAGNGWCRVEAWAVSNVVGDGFYTYFLATSQIVGIESFYHGAEAVFKFGIRNCENGTLIQSAAVNVTQKYYLTVERTGETAIECRIYTDSARTALHDTIVAALTSGRRYRYIFGALSWDQSTADTFSADIENFDLVA